MIRLVKKPVVDTNSVEGIRISELYRVYGDIALFWHQDAGKAVISMLDGDMIISGEPTDKEELSAFIGAVSPKSVFANSKTLSMLGLYENSLKVSVLLSNKKYRSTEKSDTLSSKDVYDLLSCGGFQLPEYEFFATDYCLRLNKNRLRYFAIRDTAVAMCIGKRNVLINGMLSKESGCGSRCLNGLLSEADALNVYVCATEKAAGFYVKNGFCKIYDAGYWRK